MSRERTFEELLALHGDPGGRLTAREVEELVTYAVQFKAACDEHVRSIDRLTDRVVDAEGVLHLLIENQNITGVSGGYIVVHNEADYDGSYVATEDEYIDATDEQRALVVRLLEEAAS